VSVFDWDDHCDTNDAMPFMYRLKAINPAFKATLFTIPWLCSQEFIDSHPDWVELVPHGWTHPSPYECLRWTREDMEGYIEWPQVLALGVKGFKAPGWQINVDIYAVLLENGWWVADQHLEDGRRPADLPVYLYEDGPNWHGHVQNVCGNGLAETWDTVVEKVRNTSEFLFASEAVKVPVA